MNEWIISELCIKYILELKERKKERKLSYIYMYVFSRCFYPKWLTKQEQRQYIRDSAILVIYNANSLLTLGYVKHYYYFKSVMAPGLRATEAPPLRAGHWRTQQWSVRPARATKLLYFMPEMDINIQNPAQSLRSPSHTHTHSSLTLISSRPLGSLSPAAKAHGTGNFRNY